MDVEESIGPELCPRDLENITCLLEDDLASTQEIARRFGALGLRNSHPVILQSRLLCEKDVAVNHFAKFRREKEQPAFGLGLHPGGCGYRLGRFRRSETAAF